MSAAVIAKGKSSNMVASTLLPPPNRQMGQTVAPSWAILCPSPHFTTCLLERCWATTNRHPTTVSTANQRCSKSNHQEPLQKKRISNSYSLSSKEKFQILDVCTAALEEVSSRDDVIWKLLSAKTSRSKRMGSIIIYCPPALALVILTNQDILTLLCNETHSSKPGWNIASHKVNLHLA